MTRPTRTALRLTVAAAVCLPLTGCLVAGYSAGSGWWVWPGSLVVTLMTVLVWLLTRR